MFGTLSQLLRLTRQTSGRLVLSAALAGIGTVSTAQAHHEDFDLRIDGHGATIERRHWDAPVYEDRPVQVWVEPVYQTVPGQRVWVEPVYRTVVDHVWREPVVQDQPVQVWVEGGYFERECRRGEHHGRRERVWIPAHYETRVQPTIVTPGHYEDVPRKELVTEGHWQCNDQQVLVTPGHYETQVQRVMVREGHYDERPVIRVGR